MLGFVLLGGLCAASFVELMAWRRRRAYARGFHLWTDLSAPQK